jgi:hypothetical protein
MTCARCDGCRRVCETHPGRPRPEVYWYRPARTKKTSPSALNNGLPRCVRGSSLSSTFSKRTISLAFSMLPVASRSEIFVSSQSVKCDIGRLSSFSGPPRPTMRIRAATAQAVVASRSVTSAAPPSIMSLAASLAARSAESWTHAQPTAKDYLRRNALNRRARSPDLVLRLSVQPLDRDQRGPMACSGLLVSLTIMFALR